MLLPEAMLTFTGYVATSGPFSSQWSMVQPRAVLMSVICTGPGGHVDVMVYAVAEGPVEVLGLC